MKAFGKILSATLNAAFVLLTLALVWVSFFHADWVKAAVDWCGAAVRGFGAWNYLVLFLVAGIESFPAVGVVVPGQNVLVVTAGFFAPTDFFGSVACAAAGACLGNWVGYALGRKWGTWFLGNHGAAFGLGKAEETRLRAGIESKGFWFILVGKFHNFLRSFVPFVAGTAGMAPKRFWTYNVAGSVLWAFAMVGIGVVAIQNYEVFLRNISSAVLGLVLLWAAYLWFFKRGEVKRYWAEKMAEIEAAEKAGK